MDKRADTVLKHRIPVIDRMMDVLGELEVRDSGATISDLVVKLGLPRTTVYRILNSLQLHDMVQRSEAEMLFSICFMSIPFFVCGSADGLPTPVCPI